MRIGKYTYGTNNINVLFSESGKDLIVGKFCSIARNCTIYLGGNHRTDWLTTYPFGHVNEGVFNNAPDDDHTKTNGNVIIGNDVWIGNDVTIMSGVHIGDGAVIAANSHVVKDVEPYSIAGGNPAHFIKYRFDEDSRKKLLELKWWNLPEETINKLVPLLCSNDIDSLLKELLK